jgi:hypothetical protein
MLKYPTKYGFHELFTNHKLYDNTHRQMFGISK